MLSLWLNSSPKKLELQKLFTSNVDRLAGRQETMNTNFYKIVLHPIENQTQE